MHKPWTVGMVVVTSEAWPLRQAVAQLRTWQTPWGGFFRGRWGQADLVVAHTVPGKVNAALAALALLHQVQPDLLMSVGSAGGLGDLRVGDLVIATEVDWHDVGLHLDRRFVPFGEFVQRDGASRRLPLDLEEAARAWAERWPDEQTLPRPRLRWGKVVTGDQVIGSVERSHYLYKKLGALAVEMESAAVVHTACRVGVPWLVVRGISDLPGRGGGFDFTPLARLRYGAKTPRALAQAVGGLLRLSLRDPDWRRKYREVRRGILLASAHAADAALSLGCAPEVQQAVQRRSR